MPPIFVDARDLAERLGVRYDTILTWVRRGKLPHIRDGRGRYLFNLNTVLETLRQSPWTPGMRPPGGMVSMTPAPSRKTVDGPGPLRLARPQGGSPRHPQDPPLRGPGPIDPPGDPRLEARPQRGSPWPDPARRFRSSARGPDPYAVPEREAIQQENAPPARR